MDKYACILCQNLSILFLGSIVLVVSFSVVIFISIIINEQPSIDHSVVFVHQRALVIKNREKEKVSIYSVTDQRRGKKTMVYFNRERIIVIRLVT